jgi:hypothetical protein
MTTFEDPGLARLAHFLRDREYRPLYLSRLPPDQMRRPDRGRRKHDRGRRDRGQGLQPAAASRNGVSSTKPPW